MNLFNYSIGGVYKVFVRTNAGNEIVVERVELNDKYKLWIDAIGELFGGLEIGKSLLIDSKSDMKLPVSAGVRAIHTQDGRDIITGVESSWLQLEQTTRGEDEALIAEIVKQKMEKSKSVSIGLI